MAKEKSKNFIVPLVVYPYEIMFSFGQTDEELKASLKKYGTNYDADMNISSTGKGTFFINEKNQSLVRMPNIPITTTDYGYLQHEIFHAVTFIMDRIGTKFKLMTSCEAYAYLTSYITQQVYNVIW